MAWTVVTLVKMLVAGVESGTRLTVSHVLAGHALSNTDDAGK